MAHGALGAASLATAQVGRGAAGREGPGRWAAAHRLSRLKFLTLLNTYCSSCLVLVDCIFSSLDSGWSFAVSFFSLVLKMRKWKEGQTAWPPLCALAPTSPSLPCPRCAPDLGAGRFSVFAASCCNSVHHRRNSRETRAWGACLPKAR